MSCALTFMPSLLASAFCVMHARLLAVSSGRRLGEIVQATLAGSARAPFSGCFGQRCEHRFGLRPAHAGVRNRYAVTQRHTGFQILTAFFQMTFEHDADNAALAL